MRVLLMLVLLLSVFQVSAQVGTKVSTTVGMQAPRHGEVREFPNDEPQVWDAQPAQWLSVETFWLRYAASRGGLVWGQQTTYPHYDDVKEHDTLMIELDQGICLMEFFHSRWRRANDVKRWDDGFNEYGGCPYVFD